MSEISEQLWGNEGCMRSRITADDTEQSNRVQSTPRDSTLDPSINRTQSIGSVNSLLTSWLQGFNKKASDFRTRSSEFSDVNICSDPRTASQPDSANSEAINSDDNIANRPILSRNLGRNPQHLDYSGFPLSNGGGNWNVRIISETLRPDSLSLPVSPRPLYSHLAGEQMDEVSELRDFLSVPRRYEECINFFQNLDAPSSPKFRFPALCLQLELDETKARAQDLATQLEQEKMNSKTIYDNFHIAVWV